MHPEDGGGENERGESSLEEGVLPMRSIAEEDEERCRRGQARLQDGEHHSVGGVEGFERGEGERRRVLDPNKRRVSLNVGLVHPKAPGADSDYRTKQPDR